MTYFLPTELASGKLSVKVPAAITQNSIIRTKDIVISRFRGNSTNRAIRINIGFHGAAKDIITWTCVS
jgi:hypothetical protein